MTTWGSLVETVPLKSESAPRLNRIGNAQPPHFTRVVISVAASYAATP